MQQVAADDELVARARRGDTDAYASLVRRYQELAMRVAVTVAGADADPEASVQEAFVKAYRALDRLRPGAPFRPWLLTIVANEAKNRRRGMRRYTRAVGRLRRVAGAPTWTASAEHDVVQAEESGRLLDALQCLAEPDRLVLSLRFLHELTEEETARVLDVARGTVKSRQHRALQRLRVVLRALDPALDAAAQTGTEEAGHA